MNTKVEERANEPVSPGPMNSGLTIREHFAGLAMQGMLAKYGIFNATEAWANADRLIAAQNQEQGK